MCPRTDGEPYTKGTKEEKAQNRLLMIMQDRNFDAVSSRWLRSTIDQRGGNVRFYE